MSKKTVAGLSRAISAKKSSLISKAKKNGVYENFGQDEQRSLSDKFIDSSSYSEEMNNSRDAIHAFENWCSTYSG